jgi:phosphoribosylaminoimidazole (AIR) synthetase
VRKVLAALPADALAATPPFSSLQRTLGEALLTPTRLYVREVRRAIKTGAVLGLAHITGGGIEGNLPRCVASSLSSA